MLQQGGLRALALGLPRLAQVLQGTSPQSACRGLLRQLSAAASQPWEREKLDFDVCIVGAGPAGLAAAIKFRQLCQAQDKDLSVCVLEKASTIGAHTISGCVLEPRALNELIPDWKNDPTCPIKVVANDDRFLLLTSAKSYIRMPTPFHMKNKGNYVVSLSEVVTWLGNKAQELGVEVLPGFAGRSLIYDGQGAVAGVTTNDQGINKKGERKPTFQPGTDIQAKITLLAEGARGSLSQEAIKRYNLRKGMQEDGRSHHQTYALGVKEVWEVPAANHKPGLVVHTVGYPMDHATYGGGFLYHLDNNRVALGFVVGLDYENPYMSPYQEFQRWKLHPEIQKHIEGGKCLQYGARSLNEGGYQSLPKLTFPGGALLGCSAGTLNVPKIKGTHTAMLSGLCAGEAAFRALQKADEAEAETDIAAAPNMSIYENALQASWLWDELYRVRNVRPGFRWGLLPGLVHAALDQYLLRGKAWWTLSHSKPDHLHLRPAKECQPIEYPKPNGKTTFDIPTSLYRSGTNHEHDQPAHLQLKDSGVPEYLNGPHYAAPESRYCPAGVYEYSQDPASGRTKLTINAQNCLHCKACDIKDPSANIKWTVPEGGGGPNYSML